MKIENRFFNRRAALPGCGFHHLLAATLPPPLGPTFPAIVHGPFVHSLPLGARRPIPHQIIKKILSVNIRFQLPLPHPLQRFKIYRQRPFQILQVLAAPLAIFSSILPPP